MKGLSIRQPYASLVAVGEKRIETRSRRTHYRGPVLIHASSAFTRDERALCDEEPFHSALFKHDPAQVPFGLASSLPRGQVVAVARIVDCLASEDVMRLFAAHRRPMLRYGKGDLEVVRAAAHEFDFGNYDFGRYGWVLDDVQRLPNPVPATGQLGLWSPSNDVLMPTLAQVEGYAMPGPA